MVYSGLFFLLYLLFNTIGFFILFQDKKQKANQLFFSIMILFSIWAVINTTLFLITDAELASQVRRNAVLSWGIVYTVIFHFTLVVSGFCNFLESKISKKLLLILLYLPALGNLLLYFPNSYTASELYLSNIGWLTAPMYRRSFIWENYFFIYYSLCMLGSIAVLVYWNRSSNILREKKQSGMLIVGFSFAFIFASIFEIVLPLMGYFFHMV